MIGYAIRRLLLIIPTLLGIMALNFMIVQIAPGGPIEYLWYQLQGQEVTARISGTSGGDTLNQSSVSAVNSNASETYRGAQGMDPEFIRRLEDDFGFDKPLLTRFALLIKNYLLFDFGQSYFQDRAVIDLILETIPVSLSLGLWSTLLIYLIGIPLGIRKAIKDGSKFDLWSSTAIIIGYAIPSFLFAIFLIVVFAGGRYFQWFPLQGLVSENFADLTLIEQIGDYLWHLTLPVITLTIGGFATLTMLTKNSFIDEIGKNYVLTAKSKGLSEKKVLYGHVFRNAMLLVISGIPSALIGILFTGALLIEVIFSLQGLGLLGFEAVTHRDYPVMFAILYIFSLLGLLLNLIGDLLYMVIDPRIDFESRLR